MRTSPSGSARREPFSLDLPLAVSSFSARERARKDPKRNAATAKWNASISSGLAAIVRRQRSDAPQPGESIEYFTLLSLKLEETGELRSSRDSSRNYDFTSRATFGIPRPAFRFSLFLFIFVLLFLFYRVKLAMYRWLLVHLQPHPVICSTTLSGRFGGGMKVVTDIGLNGALVWEMLVGVSRDKFPPSALRGTGGQADWSG